MLIYLNSISNAKTEYENKRNDLKRKMNDAKLAYEQKKKDNDMKYITSNAFEKKISTKRKQPLKKKSITYNTSSLHNLFVDR